MLHNRSILITAGFAALAYFVYTKLNATQQKEVAGHVETEAMKLVQKQIGGNMW